MTSTPAAPKSQSMPLGVVLRRQPGLTRWQKWSWKATAVLPGAAPGCWNVLREEDGATEFHAATMPLELHRAEVEAYRVSLTMNPPTVFVVLRKRESTDEPHEVAVHAVTASAYEAQDYLDSGEEIVEPVPMTEGLVAWVRDFVDAHFEDTPFVKRKRDKKRVDLTQDGIGDPRIRQTADVYRPPNQQKPKGSGLH